MHLWNKYTIVVFNSLVHQYKWHKSQRNAQIGDVVQVHDDTALAGGYTFGQVTDVRCKQ